MGENKKIAQATLTILIFTLFSRFLGFGREMAIAYRFGATGITDAYLVAHAIPYIFDSIVGMTLATVIVPIFTGLTAQGRKEEAWKAMSTIVSGVAAFMVVIALVGIIGAPVVVQVLSGGFAPATMDLAIRLTALMMPSIVFMALAGVLGGILNANNIFGPPALGPALMNLVIILAAIIPGTWLGVYGLVLGTVLGAILYVLIQIPALRQAGFTYTLTITDRQQIMGQVLSSLWPVFLITSISQVYTIIDLRLASGLAEGSITALNYARKLMQLPYGIFVSAITTAIFPTLSRLAAKESMAEAAATLRKGMKVILLLALPCSIGLGVLRQPITTLLFERGAFNSQASAMTAEGLLYYAFGLVGLCLYLPLTRGFFAMQDMRTPFFICLGMVAVKLVLSLAFRASLKHGGLALATSAAISLNAVILFFCLERRMLKLWDNSFFGYIGAVLLASLVMGIGIREIDMFLAGYFAQQKRRLLVRVGLDIAAGAIIFTTLGYWLKLYKPQKILMLLRGISSKRGMR